MKRGIQSLKNIEHGSMVHLRILSAPATSERERAAACAVMISEDH